MTYEKQTLKVIRKLHTCDSMASALRHMVRGLRKSKEWKGFMVDMSTFGRSALPDECFGCAATCAIMDVLDSEPTPELLWDDESEARLLLDMSRNLTLEDARDLITDFEIAMDDARKGYIVSLFQFFYGRGIIPEELTVIEDEHPFYLLTDDWEEHLGKVEAMADALEDAGYRS